MIRAMARHMGRAVRSCARQAWQELCDSVGLLGGAVLGLADALIRFAVLPFLPLAALFFLARAVRGDIREAHELAMSSRHGGEQCQVLLRVCPYRHELLPWVRLYPRLLAIAERGEARYQEQLRRELEDLRREADAWRAELDSREDREPKVLMGQIVKTGDSR